MPTHGVRSVLLIDDEPAVLTAVAQIFVRRGWRVTTETNSRAAIEVYGRERPDVVMLDVEMPELNGMLAGQAGGTYGGGRYLVDTIKGADLGRHAELATVVVDFNFAYNPSCAYDPGWACPLAPPGNVLRVEVPVGERYDG